MSKNTFVKLDHLKFIGRSTKFLKENEHELNKSASLMPLKTLEVLADEDYSWAFLYEIPAKQNVILMLWAIGFLEVIIKDKDRENDLNQWIIDHVEKIKNDPDKFTDSIFNFDKEPSTLVDLQNLRIGPSKFFTLMEFFGLMKSISGQVKSLSKYGKYMSELVDDVRNGKDEAIWQAIRIDPTVLNTSVFARRIAIASLQNDEEFFKLLGNALRVRGKKTKDSLDALRVMLQVSHEAGWLNEMTQLEADRLFISELNAYSDEGQDPVRGLQKFILRWKNNK